MYVVREGILAETRNVEKGNKKPFTPISLEEKEKKTSPDHESQRIFYLAGIRIKVGGPYLPLFPGLMLPLRVSNAVMKICSDPWHRKSPKLRS